MSKIPFNPDNLIQIITASLSHEAEAQPQLKNSTDAIAIFTNACLLSVGFRLLGLSEDDRLETPVDETNPKPLPTGWNASNGSHSFHYAHSQSSLTYLIRINRLGGKTVVMGLGIGDDKTTTFDLTTKDYMSESFFPYTLPSSADITSTKLQDGFISESRMRDLATLIKINIVQKLMPNLVKEGYEEEHAQADGRQGSNSQQQQPHQRPDEDPLRVPRPYGGGPGAFGGGPRAPPVPVGGERPPGFDDEYEIMQPARGGYGSMPGRNPLSIGADDLNPPGLGPNPPMRGPFFGEGGIGGMGGMGGMHPTPDHPMFGGMGGDVGPNPRAPPGARYDPIGPGNIQPTGGLRGPRGPGGPGGAPHNPFSGFGSGDFI